MELVVTVAIAILAVIFCAGFIFLLVWAREKCVGKEGDLISEQHSKDSRSDAQLISELSGSGALHELPLGDVEILNPRLEELLSNEQWVDEASELVPHCLYILNTCRDLAESCVDQVKEAMTKGKRRPTQDTLKQIEVATRRINPRVDDVIKSFNPLEPQLLEARFTALVLSVSQLVIMTKHACRASGSLDWMEKQLEVVENHLQVLRQATSSIEMPTHPVDHQRMFGAVGGYY